MEEAFALTLGQCPFWLSYSHMIAVLSKGKRNSSRRSFYNVFFFFSVLLFPVPLSTICLQYPLHAISCVICRADVRCCNLIRRNHLPIFHLVSDSFDNIFIPFYFFCTSGIYCSCELSWTWMEAAHTRKSDPISIVANEIVSHCKLKIDAQRLSPETASAWVIVNFRGHYSP